MIYLLVQKRVHLFNYYFHRETCKSTTSCTIYKYLILFPSPDRHYSTTLCLQLNNDQNTFSLYVINAVHYCERFQQELGNDHKTSTGLGLRSKCTRDEGKRFGGRLFGLHGSWLQVCVFPVDRVQVRVTPVYGTDDLISSCCYA